MKLNMNKALAVLASFLILTTAIGIGVWSNGWPATITITPQSLADSYSYLIFTDGSTYYMKNGSTGQIDYQSTNKTLVQQYAIGNLTAGSIFLQGVSLNTSLTVGSNIFITVQNGGTLVYWVGGNEMFYVDAGVVYLPNGLEADSIVMDGAIDFGGFEATAMKLYSGTSFPSPPVAGEPYYRTDLKTLYVYDGASWNNAGTGALDSSAAYSYLVFVNGTTYYMKNGTTGQVDYSSTNASKVFQFAYGNLSIQGGGLVHVKFGTYTLTNWISPCENSTTIGNGWNTILRLDTGADTNLVRFTGVHANNIVIRDLALDGNMAGQSAPSWRDMRSGIYSGNYSAYQVGTVTNNIRLYNLYIHDIYCGAGIRLVMSDNIVIQDVKAENNGVSSTYMSDAVFVGNSTNVKITNLEATNCLDTAIALCNVQHSTVVGTRAINCGAGIAIVNEYPSTGVNASLLCNYNSIVGGFVQNCSWGNVGVNVNSYTTPLELPDHTTITGIHLLNNTYNVLNLGEHTILTGSTLGMSAPILVGTKDVWIRDGTMSITGCTINDADVGIETVYTTYQLEVSGNTFNPATLNHILNLTGSVTDLDIHGNNGFTYPSDQIGTASFIISTDGTYYYSTNCTSGQVVYFSLNASYVFQSTVDALGTGGGLISVQNGTYYCWKTITIGEDGTYVKGVSLAWNLAETPTGTTIDYNGTDSPLFKFTATSHKYFGGISDMTLRGINSSNCTGIYIEKMFSDMFFERVFIVYFYDQFKISSSGTTITTGKVWNIWIKDCLFEGYPYSHYGIHMTNTTTVNYIENIKIDGCIFSGNIKSIVIDAYNIYNVLITHCRDEQESQESIYIASGNRITISDNAIYNCGKNASNTYSGIYICNTTNTYPSNINIHDNHIYNKISAADYIYDENQMRYAINLTGYMENVNVHDNDVEYTKTVAPYQNIWNGASGFNITVRHNTGFVSPEDATGSESIRISTDGTYYYSVNCTSGLQMERSSNASSVINNAIGNLTAGRTWQETIMLKGDLGAVNNITLANYTKIVGANAKLTLVGGGNYVFMQPNSDLHDVTIEGIYFYCTTLHTGHGLQIFYFDGAAWRTSYNIHVEKCTFENFDAGIHVISYTSVFDDNNFIGNVVGLYFDAGSGVSVTNNVFRVSMLQGAQGLHLTDIGNVAVSNNFFTDYGGAGTALYRAGIWLDSSYQITITANTFASLANSAGINVGGPGRAACYAIVVSSNSFSHMGTYSIFAGYYANDQLLVTGNTVYHGAVFIGGGTGTVAPQIYASDNVVDGVSKRVSLVGSGYTVYMINNKFSNIGEADTVGTGTLVYRGNVGFVTENSGSTVSCVNGTWIATGLAGQANGAYSLKVNGTVVINSTAYVLEPTIIAENSTHVQIEFLYYYVGVAGADSINAVTATEARTIMWYFEYKP
jgi:hypothetical protein